MWDIFIDRLNETKNTKALNFTLRHDKLFGVKCNICFDVLPLYCYRQDKSCKYGILFTRCTVCNNKQNCVFKTLMYNAKKRSKTRGHEPPEIDDEWIKKKLEQQGGKCAITGIQLRMKHGDNDPFNISLERLCNNVHYTKENVVLICQWLQIGKGGDLSPEEIRNILFYNSATDNFVFDPNLFKKEAYSTTSKERRKPRKLKHERDQFGNMVLKQCGDCGFHKSLDHFAENQGYCKPCQNKRCHDNACTIKGYIKKICRHSKNRCKLRSGIKSRNDKSHEIAPNLFDLVVNQVIEQKGRCALTGIPLEFVLNSRHGASLDRLDNTLGYTNGNIQLVVIPLNTRVTPSNHEIQTIRGQYFLTSDI